MSDPTKKRARRPRRGRFIVLEGIDGAGTTTQARRLVDLLREDGHLAHLTREPSDGPIGVLIRQVLTGRVVARPGDGPAVPVDGAAVALLFAADRIDHLRSEIEPALSCGIHVVSDRYVLSSLAYQSLDADLTWVQEINSKALVPDLTLFLDVPAKVALERRASTRASEERFEPLRLQRKIARTYRDLVSSDPRLGKVVALDGTAPPDEVTLAIRDNLRALLAARR